MQFREPSRSQSQRGGHRAQEEIRDSRHEITLTELIFENLTFIGLPETIFAKEPTCSRWTGGRERRMIAHW